MSVPTSSIRFFTIHLCISFCLIVFSVFFATCSYSHNTVGQAIAQISTQIKAQPANPALLERRAGYYLLVGDLGAALSDLENALKMARLKERLLVALAGLYLQTDDPQKVLSVLKPLSASNHLYPKALRLQGQAWLKLNQLQKADTCFRQSSNMGNKSIELALARSKLLFLNGDSALAARELVELLARYPQDERPVCALLQVLRVEKQFAEGISVLNEIEKKGSLTPALKLARLELKLMQNKGRLSPEIRGEAMRLRVLINEDIEWNEGELSRDFVIRARLENHLGNSAQAKADYTRAEQISGFAGEGVCLP